MTSIPTDILTNATTAAAYGLSAWAFVTIASYCVSRSYYTWIAPVGAIAYDSLSTTKAAHQRKPDDGENENDLNKVHYIRGDYGTKLVFREIYEQTVYFQNGISLQPRDDRPLVVIDAGSNIGLFARYVLQRFPTANVVCIEPMPDLVAVIRRNTAFAEDRTRIAMTALGKTTGQDLQFEFNPNMTCGCASANDALDCSNNVRNRDWLAWAGAVLHDGLLADSLPLLLTPFFRVLSAILHAKAAPRWIRVLSFIAFLPVIIVHFAWSAGQHIPKKNVSCRTTTLEDVLYAAGPSSLSRDADIDLLKIDIEGAELDVLESLSDQTWARVKQLVVETQDIAGRVEVIRRLLASKGFTKIVSTEEEYESHTLMGITSFFASRN